MSTAFLLPALILAAAAASTERVESLALGIPGCQTSCGGVDIPYPFGIGGGGCFRKGFEIECTNNGPVLAGTSLRVVHLSVDPDQSQVMLPIGWQCYNSTSPAKAAAYEYGETTMNKDGVYRISNTHNMLVVVGCNTMAYTGSKKTEGGAANYAYYTGCMSYCNNSASAQDGLCAGVGCCHVDIPPGLTDNYFKFWAEDHSTMLEYSPCDYAFLVDKTNYTFRRSDLLMDRNRTSLVWLDWAIRGDDSISSDILSCPQVAKSTTAAYACVSNHSDCINSINGPGYNCKCSKGYEGNAYVVNGCTNIDECDHRAKYCYGRCEDTDGSYLCSCPPGYRSDNPRSEPCTPKIPLVAQISIGATCGVLILAFSSFAFVLRKEKRKTKEFYLNNGGPTLKDAKIIRLYKKEELRPIIKSGNLIGHGGFGEVYKGVLDKVHVAVKKPKSGNVLENKQFTNEVIVQSRVIHKNIVRLIGCCLEVGNPMLVYEFISKGSVHDILHEYDKRETLSLDVRLSILAESAYGLAYMHSQAHTRILHGDVKPANILLDENFVPKISDFGISRLIAVEKEHTAHVIGDMSYMDPAYLQTGLLTEKSDVYSFGVVILEVISRKKATHSDNNSLVTSFLERHKNGKKTTELFDEDIAATEDLELLDTLARIAVECLNLDVDQRPSMTDVAERLHILIKFRKQ